jgi:hypothetical protein
LGETTQATALHTRAHPHHLVYDNFPRRTVLRVNFKTTASERAPLTIVKELNQNHREEAINFSRCDGTAKWRFLQSTFEPSQKRHSDKERIET